MTIFTLCLHAELTSGFRDMKTRLMFAHCISAAELPWDVRQSKTQQMIKRRGILLASFFYPSKLRSSTLLHHAFVIDCIVVKWQEQGRKNSHGGKKAWKEQVSGTRKLLSSNLGTKLREKSQTKSASDDNKPFFVLVELIQSNLQ